MKKKKEPPRRKISPIKETRRKYARTIFPADNLENIISEYDPEFLFLPALLIASKKEEKIKDGESARDAMKKIIKEFNIGENSRAVKIMKLAERIWSTK